MDGDAELRQTWGLRKSAGEKVGKFEPCDLQMLGKQSSHSSNGKIKMASQSDDST
jgi:hypothetical protein